MKHSARYIVSIALFIAGIALFQMSPERFGGFPTTGPSFANNNDAEYMLGKVERITDEGVRDEGIGMQAPYQTVDVNILSGGEHGATKRIDYGNDIGITDLQKVHANDYVVIAKALQSDEPIYYIADSWRLSPMLAVLLFFFAIAILFAGRRGAFAIIGCGFSIWILVSYLIPAILGGADPFTASILATVGIATVSILVGHGFRRRTFVALMSTILTLFIAAGLAKLFVNMTVLTGTGTEEAFLLKFGSFGALNLKGLLLAGIMVGVLGVLDDVTTAQAAAVEELKFANPNFRFADLYERGISIGSEHIASLVNTLVLAYAGASFPLFLIFSASRTQPMWFIINSEFLAEEIIRTLIGSSALVLAVPLTTLIAAWVYHAYIPKESQSHHH